MERPLEHIVVMGASAGALDTLMRILPSISAPCPVPIVIVVHLLAGKESLMAHILQQKCQLPVQEAEDKMPIEPGMIYVAPPNYHLQVEMDGCFSLSTEEPVHYSRPSIDVLFETAADVFQSGTTGIVLTGASQDGAAGLKAIIEAGGQGLIQDIDEAEMPVMPKAAMEACPEARVMTSAAIGAYLNNQLCRVYDR